MLVFSLAGAPLSVSQDATQAVNLLYCRSPSSAKKCTVAYARILTIKETLLVSRPYLKIFKKGLKQTVKILWAEIFS